MKNRPQGVSGDFILGGCVLFCSLYRLNEE